MKNRFLSFLICFIMVLSCLPQGVLFAKAANSGTCGTNLTWTVSDSGVLTISGTGAMKDFDHFTAPTWANATTTIKSVVIKSGVTSIGAAAFYGHSTIESVTIPASVTSIGDYAFDTCSSLSAITIPSTVTYIGESAFYGCSKLTSITIPKSVTYIGSSPFRGCTKLASIAVNSANANYCSVDDVLFNKAKTRLLQYPPAKSNTSYSIPTSVTYIGTYAFYGCSKLTSITIPSSVATLSDYAFSSCRGLTSVTIPESVTQIGQYSFYNCSNLSSITLPSTIIDFGPEVFTSTAYYNNAENWENNILYISSHLMDSKVNITSADIKYGTTNIAAYAFSNQSKLSNVTMPDSVIAIGDGAFNYCTNLKNIALPDSVALIGSSAFGSSGLTSIKIPNGITTIDGSTFSSCKSLTSITIPKSVTQIGYSAFSSAAITDVYYNGGQADWTAIDIKSYNTPLTKATIHYILGQEISSTSYANGVLTVNVTFTNASASNATVYAAVYSKDGKFKGATSVTQDISSNNTASLKISCTNETGDYVKAFTLDEKSAPLCETVRAYV